MKPLFKISILAITFVILFAFSSCEKDEGKLPNIGFKTGVGYTSTSTSLAGGSPMKIGITASKSEDKDVLKTFNISKSVNGGATTTVSNTTLTSAQEDNFDFDFTTNAEPSGSVVKYIFTITNRDGLSNSVDLTITSM